MAKTLCKTFGVVLLLVGFAGFAKSDLLGLHLTGMHNVVHIFTAGIALYIGFAETASAARTLCLVFGAIYLLLGVLGFVAPGVVTAIIGVGPDAGLGPDSIVHLLLGAIFLIVGLLPEPKTVTA